MALDTWMDIVNKVVVQCDETCYNNKPFKLELNVKNEDARKCSKTPGCVYQGAVNN